MKREVLIIFVLFNLFISSVSGQIDSLSGRLLYTWTIDPTSLDTKYNDIDTSLNDFQLFNPLLKSTITSNYLGNLGSASQSNIFYDRRINETGFLFSEPFGVYFLLPYEHNYFNTKRQFTVLNYSSGGPKEESEQLLGVLHTQNVTKDFNVGLKYDLVSSDGRYLNQKTQIHSATLFTSYKHKGYQIHGNYTLNKVNNEENGGIDSLHYLGSREYSRALTIPVKLNDASSKIVNSSFYIAQEYKFGKYDEVETETKAAPSADVKPIFNPKGDGKGISNMKKTSKTQPALTDTIISSPKPEEVQLNDSLSIALNDSITPSPAVEKKQSGLLMAFSKLNGFSISHELTYNANTRKFSDSDISESFYTSFDTLINTKKTNDAVYQNLFGNKFSAHFRYNDLFNFRLSFYTEQINYTYNIIPDSIFTFNSENQPLDTIIKADLENDFSNNSVSAHMKTVLFNHILFTGTAEYYLSGYKKENSKINLLLGYRLFSDVWLHVEGEYRNKRPDYFYEHFQSNQFKWDNDYLIRTEEWDGNIILKSDKYRFALSAGYGQITGYMYLDTLAKVQQYADQINILTARANKKITLGVFHSTTQFVYQTTTNDSILNLPELNLYQSLYYEKLFHFSSTGGELRMQFGVDYRYSSSFYADKYMPVTGLYYRQFDQKLDDYQCLDVFLNFAIKRARLYLVYNYLNTAINDSYYFTSPSYPAPPAVFKFGISWTFYD
ncbi:MAG: putative porin [Bacteroidales bacterium]